MGRAARAVRARRTVLLGWALGSVALAAEIQGVVLENASGRPLARAEVTVERIRGGGGTDHQRTWSDPRGRFLFSGLPAGAYLVSARRQGYLRARYGQRSWDGAGVPIVLDEDSQFFAEIRLARPGVITGRVLDENGVGMPGHAVYAFRAGGRPVRVVGAALTDDRGVYRLTGLEPGAYYVRTGPRQLEDGRGLLPTFYRQSTVLAEARAVSVELDSETQDVDIEPLPGKLVKLTGRLTAAPATVTLYGDAWHREAQVGLDGAFQFDELAPGSYQLLALTADRPLRVAWERVTVGEGGLETVLELAAPASLTVHCVERGGGKADAKRTNVFLHRQDPPGGDPLRVEGGTTVTLLPGIYGLGVSAPLDRYVADLQGPRTALGPGLFEAPVRAALEVTVVLGTRPGAVSGRVLDPDGNPVVGAPVFVRADDPVQQYLMDAARKATRSDASGVYRIHGLAPGRYRIFSSFEVEQPREQDWEKYGASSVTVGEGESVKLDLRLAGGM
ncbi:MAG: carboxypeptidase-like regulatory domain-containing protein [Bryobacterales bacterium]|nr:carboxypeptidase-like regulatory domain-containing protein [Bryobacteraceae bacterium]MDW8130943.1 carboxypeptidase-like regulatory domain-containing protein [Bryobacterales bacterium]